MKDTLSPETEVERFYRQMKKELHVEARIAAGMSGEVRENPWDDIERQRKRIGGAVASISGEINQVLNIANEKRPAVKQKAESAIEELAHMTLSPRTKMHNARKEYGTKRREIKKSLESSEGKDMGLAKKWLKGMGPTLVDKNERTVLYAGEDARYMMYEYAVAILSGEAYQWIYMGDNSQGEPEFRLQQVDPDDSDNESRLKLIVTKARWRVKMGEVYPYRFQDFLSKTKNAYLNEFALGIIVCSISDVNEERVIVENERLMTFHKILLTSNSDWRKYSIIAVVEFVRRYFFFVKRVPSVEWLPV